VPEITDSRLDEISRLVSAKLAAFLRTLAETLEEPAALVS